MTNIILDLADFLFRVTSGVKRRLLFMRLGYRPDSDLSADLVLKNPANISIGSKVKIGPGCTLGAMSPIRICDEVTLSQDVIVETGGLSLRGGRHHKSKPITIHKGAWIGARSIILSGVTIGEFAVIGAGLCIRSDVPSNEIVRESR